MQDDPANDSEYEDDEPTPEELAQIELAKPQEVAAVDALLLSKCTDRWRKVAMIVGSSLDEFDANFPNLPYIFMQVRILELVEKGLVVAQGDVMAMRHSEIRLPKSSNE